MGTIRFPRVTRLFKYKCQQRHSHRGASNGSRENNPSPLCLEYHKVCTINIPYVLNTIRCVLTRMDDLIIEMVRESVVVVLDITTQQFSLSSSFFSLFFSLSSSSYSSSTRAHGGEDIARESRRNDATLQSKTVCCKANIVRTDVPDTWPARGEKNRESEKGMPMSYPRSGDIGRKKHFRHSRGK